MLFDILVRYGEQHNQGLEAENEAPLTHPTQLTALAILNQLRECLFPVPCSLFPVPFAITS
ncbi:hypothetical protein [Moorena producens]|uniref:hypothetical protein n=1 Tax=Moorena producens TaxID=1155739 RepID=UPI003C75FF8A